MTVAFYLECWEQTYQEGLGRGLSELLACVFADNFVAHRAQQMQADMRRGRSHDN